MTTLTERDDAAPAGSSLDLLAWYLWAMGIPSHAPNPGRLARARQCFTEVIHAWTAPERAYHTLTEHLIPLLQSITNTPAGESLGIWAGRTLVGAAFYHDGVYNPMWHDSRNVAASRALWETHYSRIYCDTPTPQSDLFRSDVSKQITDTDYSLPSAISQDDRSLRNFDLLSLARPWDDFMHTGGLVEQEQRRANLGFDQASYDQGQIKWLCYMINQDRIFPAKGSFWDGKELETRSNLGRYLAQLVEQ